MSEVRSKEHEGTPPTKVTEELGTSEWDFDKVAYLRNLAVKPTDGGISIKGSILVV